MLEVIIPVYDMEHFHALNSLEWLRETDANSIKITIIDDSIDQNVDLHGRNIKVPCTITKNGQNKGTLASRLQASYRSTGDYVYFLDADDYLDYPALKSALACMNPEISMMTTACYKCDGPDMIEYLEAKSTYELDHYKVVRSTRIVGSLWRGDDLRACSLDLLTASLYSKLCDICEDSKIVLQEDEFFWMWCKCWMFNNQRSYTCSWIPTFCYNQYYVNKTTKDYKPIDVDSKSYKKHHDAWLQVLKEYWKF